jgi:DNA topoisomerase II
MNSTTIQDFLENEYSNSALYDCFRSIASYIDGLKPSSRKVVYTVKKQNIIKDSKVSRLASMVAMETQYLHGENSLQGVIVGMTQDFVGSNNLPLLSPNGNFGSRFIPNASAARYIYSKKSPNFNSLFNKDDDKILLEQEFEGDIIEPKFFVPVLPLILVNGNEGMGTGYAQKIFPRKISDLKQAIIDIITTGDTKKRLKPHYKDFNGKVTQGETANSWVIKGSYRLENSCTIYIDELPVGYSLAYYLKVLNKLEETGKIKSFEDLSEDENFLFKVSVKRQVTTLSKESLMSLFKLEKRVSENFTCIDENNSIIIFNSAIELLKRYITIKLEYYEKRRQNRISEIQLELSYLDSIKNFIKRVISGELLVSNQKKDSIVKQLEKQKDILKKEGSYDYLLKMPIYSLTYEKVKQLEEKIASKKKDLFYFENNSASSLWKEELCQVVL